MVVVDNIYIYIKEKKSIVKAENEKESNLCSIKISVVSIQSVSISSWTRYTGI